jgi:hypothetical protein
MRSILLLVSVNFLIILAGCEKPLGQTQVNVNWNAPQNTIKNIVVLDFNWAPPQLKLEPGYSSGCISDAGAVVSDMVASELISIKRYNVKDKGEIKRAVEEKQFQLSDLLAKGDYGLIGKLGQVDAVVIGRVSSANVYSIANASQFECSYTCRCVSTGTGDVLWSIGGEKSVSWTNKLGPYWLRTLTRELVQELDKKLQSPPNSQ